MTHAASAKLRDRDALFLFFAIAFGVSWTGWIGMQVQLATNEASPILPYLFYAGVAVSVAGLIAAAAMGWSELRRVVSESVRVNAGLATWALVVAVPVVWIVASALIYATMHPGGLGRVDLAAFWATMTRPSGLMNLAYPLGEEIGWRGFLLPLLMRRRSALGAALIVGVVWAVWHAPFYWTRILDNPAWFVTFSFGVICLSVIFAGVYLISRSVLATIALHWHINAIQDAAGPLFPDLPELGGGHDPYTLTMSAVIFAIAVLFAVALATFRSPPHSTPEIAS